MLNSIVYGKSELKLFGLWVMVMLLDGTKMVAVAPETMAQMGVVAMAFLVGRAYVKSTDGTSKPGVKTSEFLVVAAWMLAALADGTMWFTMNPDSIAMLGHAAMTYSAARSYTKGRTVETEEKNVD